MGHHDSPDGRHRWDGSIWVPVPSGSSLYYEPPATTREPTSWTQPLQYAVIAWYGGRDHRRSSTRCQAAGLNRVQGLTMPAWSYWESIAAGTIATILFAWMLYATLKIGPRGMRRVS